MLKKISLTLVSLLMLFALGIQFYLLKAVPVPEKTAHQLDIVKLRNMAGSGAKPQAIHSLLVAKGSIPEVFAIDGGSWDDSIFNMYSYQIVYQDGFGIIDAVFDEQTQQQQMPGGEVFAGAYQTMQRGLSAAKFVAITHEHLDHSVGIAKADDVASLATKTYLTQEQLASADLLEAGFSPAQVALFQPLVYQDYHLLAPGVVLIKAPSHTPGSQLVYIQLANGSEFLLLGDVAWLSDNVSIPRAHPRLTNILLGEDLAATQSWLRLLHDLQKSNPEIHQVVAHDGPQMLAYVSLGLIQQGFINTEG